MFKRLFYSLNNNKQFSRQVQVLYYLSSIHTSVSIIELAEHVQCSIPTLRTDIRELNHDLPHYVQVESLGKNGYFLSYPEGVSIQKITMELAKNTDVYRILDGIFRNEIYTFDELSYELFISPFTLKRALAHINEELQQFNISLSSTTIEFKGCESDIRYFFYAFYSDFNDLTVVDPDYEHHSHIYQNILNQASKYQDGTLHLNFFRTTLWLMIFRQRLLNGNKLDHPSNFEIESASMENYTTFAHTLAHNFFDIKAISDDEIMWLYTIILHCISYSEPNRNLLDYEEHTYLFHREVCPDFLNRVNTFLSLEFDQALIDSPYTESIRSFLINLESLTSISNVFQKLSLSTRIFTKESINEYYLHWLKHLESEEAHALFPIFNKEDTAVALAMLHFSVLSHLKYHVVKILFAFQGEPGYDDFLIQTTQFMIPHSVHPYYIFDEPITLETIDTIQADLVVSNYDLPNSDAIPCPIIRLSYIPNLSEWTHLRNVILSKASVNT